jgi:hypothetical protein
MWIHFSEFPKQFPFFCSVKVGSSLTLPDRKQALPGNTDRSKFSISACNNKYDSSNYTSSSSFSFYHRLLAFCLWCANVSPVRSAVVCQTAVSITARMSTLKVNLDPQTGVVKASSTLPTQSGRGFAVKGWCSQLLLRKDPLKISAGPHRGWGFSGFTALPSKMLG